MNIKMLAIIVIGLGCLIVAFGGFTYVKSSKTTNLGPVEFSIKDKERVNIPLWVGASTLLAGGALLIFGRKKTSA